jgi:hypothetical protein
MNDAEILTEMQDEKIVQSHFAVVTAEDKQLVGVDQRGGVAPAPTRCLALGAHHGPLARLAVVEVHVVEQSRLIAAPDEHEARVQGRARVTTARLRHGTGGEGCAPRHGLCAVMVLVYIGPSVLAEL